MESSNFPPPHRETGSQFAMPAKAAIQADRILGKYRFLLNRLVFQISGIPAFAGMMILFLHSTTVSDGGERVGGRMPLNPGTRPFTPPGPLPHGPQIPPASIQGVRRRLQIRSRIFLGFLGGSFFCLSGPAAHLLHPGHHLRAVAGEAAFLRLHHFFHHLRKGHSLAKTLKSFFCLFLFIRHLHFLLSSVVSSSAASFAASIHKTKEREERLHPKVWRKNPGTGKESWG